MQLLAPPPLSDVQLKDYDPDDTGGLSREEASEQQNALQDRMLALQERLFAEKKKALLIVLQAMDTGGKDGTIRRVFSGVNPQGVIVSNFKAPTAEELSRDYLWRIHLRVPPKGYIGIFNRSHYEDVLIVRVNELVPEAVWRQRYDQINAFEKLLVDTGTHILKFYLHISKQEQKKRLQSRLDDPSKRWKFSLDDLPVRERWDDYMRAYEDALKLCNTSYAPWYIVPANRKWYRDLVVTRAIVEALEAIDPQFPKPQKDLSTIVIPD